MRRDSPPDFGGVDRCVPRPRPLGRALLRSIRQSGGSQLSVVPAWSMASRHRPGGAGGQDTGLVVGGISVSPADAFDLLDAGIGGLGASIGDAGPNEHLDVRPPRLDGCGREFSRPRGRRPTYAAGCRWRSGACVLQAPSILGQMRGITRSAALRVGRGDSAGRAELHRIGDPDNGYRRPT